MQNGYANARAITRHFGKGVFLLTFTVNCVDECLRKYGADKRASSEEAALTSSHFYAFLSDQLDHIFQRNEGYFLSVEYYSNPS
ncbi:hypothetical protein QR680_018442 [Steinernema hermaphroditum]|uniref:Uncharacterized protein n=1 Tax=Steinernema hermaphroditum TaxID=289476 RepID=A0AA39HHZ5_9BILA|nr:hypothetical protein QR680_018442 [Steinernema hermaphroditum]